MLVAGVWLGTGSLFSDGAEGPGLLMGAVAVGLAAVAIACRMHQPTGYEVEPDGLVVVRRRGRRRFAGAPSDARPRPFERGDLRLFGTGGLYGYVGRFRLQDVGWTSAQLTSGPDGVLVTVGERDVLVSPGDRAAFIAATAGGADA